MEGDRELAPPFPTFGGRQAGGSCGHQPARAPLPCAPCAAPCASSLRPPEPAPGSARRRRAGRPLGAGRAGPCHRWRAVQRAAAGSSRRCGMKLGSPWVPAAWPPSANSLTARVRSALCAMLWLFHLSFCFPSAGAGLPPAFGGATPADRLAPFPSMPPAAVSVSMCVRVRVGRRRAPGGGGLASRNPRRAARCLLRGPR